MASGVLNMTRGLGTALGLAVTGTIFTVAGGDIVKAGGAAADAAHAFSVTAYVLAGIAAAAGIVAALRSVGTLRYAKLSSIE
jgi:hypothetical protein